MPRNKDEPKQTVWKNHSFHWKTHLTNKRMEEISDWLGILDADKRQMISELLEDQRDQDAFDNAGESI